MNLEPDMDDDGYPTEFAAKAVATWPYNNAAEMMEYVRRAWRYGDCGYWDQEDIEEEGRKVRRYTISTAGWSGNETLIGAMEENVMFWIMCWQQSRRGGHYVFEIKL